MPTVADEVDRPGGAGGGGIERGVAGPCREPDDGNQDEEAQSEKQGCGPDDASRHGIGCIERSIRDAPGEALTLVVVSDDPSEARDRRTRDMISEKDWLPEQDSNLRQSD